jgi:D-glycero-alpha-D-manno-heptose 1-phosphate guanylyltransferase
MEAIILAGGFGTRLKGVVNDVPKSMASVNEKPFLEYLLNFLSGQGIQKAILSVGYLKEPIREHFHDRYRNIRISYAIEEEPLGTGGAVLNSLKHVEGERAVVMNGDSMFRIDLNALQQLHQANNADVSIALRYLEDTSRYGSVIIDPSKRIVGFREKNAESSSGYINGGIYLINRKYFTETPFPARFSIEKDCFEKCYSTSRMFGYPSRGYFLDIGIPEDYMRAQDEFIPFED